MNDMREDCAAFRVRLNDRARENLSDADRRAVADHVAGCDECRREAMAVDPALLFAALRGGPLPERLWEGFDRDLRTRIAAEATRATPARVAAHVAAFAAGLRDAITWAPGPAIWAAPAVMVLVLGAMVAVLRPGVFQPGPPRAPRVEALRSPYAPPGVPGSARIGDGREVPAVVPALVTFAGEPPALEEVASPAARVYRFDAPDSGLAPIYLVVDESIEF